MHRSGKFTLAKAKAIVDGFDPSVAEGFFVTGMMSHIRSYEARQRSKPLDADARSRMAAATRRTKADIAYCREHRIPLTDLAAHKLKGAVAMLQESAEKAAKYDKVVEMLDTWMVGGVALGECTKAKLLAEAARFEATAADLATHASVYTRLAGHMRDGETVRTSTKRETMLDILLALKPA